MAVQRPGEVCGAPDRNAIKSTGTLMGCREKLRCGVFSNAGAVAALIGPPPQDRKSFSCGWNQRRNAARVKTLSRVYRKCPNSFPQHVLLIYSFDAFSDSAPFLSVPSYCMSRQFRPTPISTSTGG